MKMTLHEIALLVDGTVVGDSEIEITGASTIRDAQKGDITLANDARLAGELKSSSASAVIVSGDFTPEGVSHVRVADVHKAFERIVGRFCPPWHRTKIGVSKSAQIGSSVTIGRDVDVYPNAIIGDNVIIGRGTVIHSGVVILDGTIIGEDTTIFPSVTLYENTRIGSRCIIHAGVVIGAYGFGYDTVEGRHKISAQLGYVIVEDEVHIGSCSTIDRGTYGPTVIGEGTKIDNMVMVAHNCRIGKHNLLCSQVGIAGSCSTGDYVVMAGQVGVGDHIHIGDRAVLGAKSGVMSDVPEAKDYLGIPATPIREQMHKQAALSKLPEMRKQFKAMQRQIDWLEKQLEQSQPIGVSLEVNRNQQIDAA